MSIDSITAALEALRYWAARIGAAGEGAAGVSELVRRAAWLVGEQAAPAGGWPQLDVTQPLASIFSRVQPAQSGGATATIPTVYLRRGSLALSKAALFPVETRAEALQTIGTDPIAALAGAITTLAGQQLPPEAHLEGLLYAFQRHTWSLPSPLAGVALYDFARTHAAVAAALAAHDGELFLAGGDLSGVQSFLYTLTAAGATKSLRGRSFYLQLLTDVCARWLLRAAGLPLTNLLYAGGGRFYLLLPGRIAGLSAGEWLARKRTQLGSFFLHRHQGDLYLALGGAMLAQADLLDQQRFAAAWGRATEATNEAKRRRFADLGDELAQLFEPQGHGGGNCAVCGYQGEPSELIKDPNDPRGQMRCRLCDSFEHLGRLLHNADWLLLHHLNHSTFQPGGQRQSYQETLRQLGIHIQISGDHAHPDDQRNRSPNPQHVRWTTALAIQEDPQTQPPAPGGPVVSGFRPVANTTPTMTAADLEDWERLESDEPKPAEGDVKPFGVMVEQSKGIKRLGVLRMDVDDLGDLFRYRLDSGLARVSALSAALGLFFEGWVGRLCDHANRQAERGSVYSIYSGGDDLFIVGSWHLLPDLARQISDDLALYARNPCVHLSAGISLHPAKFPLYQAAEAAREELERAKQLPNKAALGWLEQTVKWEHAGKLFSLVEQLYAYTEPGTLPRALLQTLQQLYVQYVSDQKQERRNMRPDQFVYGPWVWRRMYQLTRIAEQAARNDKATKDWIYNLRDHVLEGIDNPAHTGGRAIERAGLAARWVEFLIRKERDNGTGERRGSEEDH